MVLYFLRRDSWRLCLEHAEFPKQVNPSLCILLSWMLIPILLALSVHVIYIPLIYTCRALVGWIYFLSEKPNLQAYRACLR